MHHLANKIENMAKAMETADTPSKPRKGSKAKSKVVKATPAPQD